MDPDKGRGVSGLFVHFFYFLINNASSLHDAMDVSCSGLRYFDSKPCPCRASVLFVLSVSWRVLSGLFQIFRLRDKHIVAVVVILLFLVYGK